jgi:SAM-dependent methyltransferase
VKPVLSPQETQKVDLSDDLLFYEAPRLVYHTDESFVAKLQGLLEKVLPPQAEILDLMSSWVSHLPKGYQPKRVVGHGMNTVELSQNPVLSDYFVQNLNETPQLPLADESFDVVLNTVSIQYLQQPVEVLQEVHRILKPGGLVVISFSNRMFPTKAIQAWCARSDDERLELVTRYIQTAGDFENIQIHAQADSAPSAWWMPWAQTEDPFYAVVAYKTRGSEICQ